MTSYQMIANSRNLLYASGGIQYLYKYIGEDAMSISVTLVGRDGVVVATDSLRTSINPKNISQDYAQKLWIWKGSLAIMVVGSNTRYSDWMLERFSKTRLNDISDFEDIVDSFSRYAKDDYIGHSHGEPKLETAMIFVMVGYGTSGDAKIIQLDSTRPNMLFTPNLIESPHILSFEAIPEYWLDKLNYKSWGIKSLMRLAIFLINESSKMKTGMIGGDIQLAFVSSNGAKMVDIETINQIKSEIDNIIDIKAVEDSLNIG